MGGRCSRPPVLFATHRGDPMDTVDLSALRRGENLGFSYFTADPVSTIESPRYFDLARDHFRPGERLFVTAGLGRPRLRPSVQDYLVVAVDRQSVTLQPIVLRCAPARISQRRKG